MPKSLTTEEFKERIKQISNGNIEIIGEYKGINELVSCKCKNVDIFGKTRQITCYIGSKDAKYVR